MSNFRIILLAILIASLLSFLGPSGPGHRLVTTLSLATIISVLMISNRSRRKTRAALRKPTDEAL
jgi:hypothetical protein